MIVSFLNLTERKRKKLLNKIKPTTLNKSYINYLKTPLADLKNNIENIEFLALDFETTGLDPNNDSILSVGYTIISNNKIKLKENGHHIIRLDTQLNEGNVVVHQITDNRMQQGEYLLNVTNTLLDKLCGRVLLVHFENIEKSFLNAVCKRLFGGILPVHIVDTMKIEHKKLSRTKPLIKGEDLRLFNIRSGYKLPRYKAHSALEDAISTAELFLLQMEKNGAKNITLKDII